MRPAPDDPLLKDPFVPSVALISPRPSLSLCLAGIRERNRENSRLHCIILNECGGGNGERNRECDEYAPVRKVTFKN